VCLHRGNRGSRCTRCSRRCSTLCARRQSYTTTYGVRAPLASQQTFTLHLARSAPFFSRLEHSTRTCCSGPHDPQARSLTPSQCIAAVASDSQVVQCSLPSAAGRPARAPGWRGSPARGRDMRDGGRAWRERTPGPRPGQGKTPCRRAPARRAGDAVGLATRSGWRRGAWPRTPIRGALRPARFASSALNMAVGQAEQHHRCPPIPGRFG